MFKIAFVSNYFNHHQKELSEALNKITDEYYFIATVRISEERLSLGWGKDSEPSYVLHFWENKDQVEKVIENAEVIILGSVPLEYERYILKRHDKLFFRYSERLFKKGIEWPKFPIRFIRWHKRNPMNRRIYLLCASAYTAGDFKKLGLFKNKAYKWGYFPETKKYQDIDSLIKNKNKNEVLWCGRFIDWKHPDDVIEVAKRLAAENYSFNINMIGCGDMEDTLRNMVKKYKLDNNVHFLGSMAPEKVRSYMERAGIYLFTSDRGEGWGAVLNESMNSACAVIASHAIGSVPFLINDGENGMIYQSGNVEMLYEKVKSLLDDPKIQSTLGVNAYDTMVNEWNADVAAERFVKLSEAIIKGDDPLVIYENGICSKAK